MALMMSLRAILFCYLGDNGAEFFSRKDVDVPVNRFVDPSASITTVGIPRMANAVAVLGLARCRQR